jgi:transposase
MCGNDQAGQRFEAHGQGDDGRPRWSSSRRLCRLGFAHEVTLVAPTLDSRFVAELPQRLIGDRAYDADRLDEALVELGIEMIAPHRRNRTRPKTQDRCPLRRYRHRWKVVRLFAWLGNFRRLVVRYERHALNYLGFVHLGCIVYLAPTTRGRRGHLERRRYPASNILAWNSSTSRGACLRMRVRRACASRFEQWKRRHLAEKHAVVFSAHVVPVVPVVPVVTGICSQEAG